MTPDVAVLTLTRDRLDYTKHCFHKLHEHAGIAFDHFVLDQGSEDGTRDWLVDEYDPAMVVLQPENVGINRGMNELVDRAFEMDDYDVIVKFDNDCELVHPNTVRDITRLVIDGGCILSPRILGLQNPPQPTGELRIGDEVILDVPQIGGIFYAVPAWIYSEFRYDDSKLLYDDVDLCWWLRGRGGTCGYVKRLEAWHYRTTIGQHEDYPEYFERRVLEGGPA